MPKMIAPNTTIVVVPAASITDVADLFKSATYNTGGKATNLSCAITTGFTLNATDSTKVTSQAICDASPSEVPVGSNYEIEMTFFREEIGEDQQAPGTTSPYDKAFQLFKDGIQKGLKDFYWVKRIGFRPDVPFKAGQLISIYKGTLDNPQDVEGDNQPIQFKAKFGQAGYMVLNQPLTS